MCSYRSLKILLKGDGIALKRAEALDEVRQLLLKLTCPDAKQLLIKAVFSLYTTLAESKRKKNKKKKIKTKRAAITTIITAMGI